MSILQAIAGFVYQIQVVTTFAYLPEMARQVGETMMNNFTTAFTQSQFASQATFNIVVIGTSLAFSLSTVQTAMVGQTACVIWGVLFFTWGWRLMPPRPARHTLNENQFILTAGFAQNWRTAKAIWTQYRKGLKWYLLALIFAEASAAAITNISIIYLNDTIGLSVTQIGIFFMVALVGTIPGSKIGSIITHKTNPNTSCKLSQLALIISLIIGAFTLEDLKGPKELSYIWGFVVGMILGWFYPSEEL
jgi:MFS-type transporter involved in bile tolerance (Atg22 family)